MFRLRIRQSKRISGANPHPHADGNANPYPWISDTHAYAIADPWHNAEPFAFSHSYRRSKPFCLRDRKL